MRRSLVFIIALVIVVGIFNQYASVRGIVYAALSPSLRIFASVGEISASPLAFFGIQQDEEVQRLTQKQNELEALQLRQSVRISELEEVVEREAAYRDARTGVRAPVLNHFFNGFSEFIVADAGNANEIVEGALATYEDVILGRVVQATRGTSQILFAHSAFTENTGVIERTGVQLDLVGKGAGFYVAQVPKDADILEGDIVINSYRDRYVFGEVIDIIISPVEPFKELFVRNPVNVSVLKEVYIQQGA